MSELKEKIAEAIGNHISISDTYTYELTRVKTAFEAGTISLEDFEEWSDENVNNLAESIVDVLQPQLNDNQQIVLEWLKGYLVDDCDFRNTLEQMYSLQINGIAYKKENLAFMKLTERELAQVVQVFSNWFLEQEEENNDH